MNKLKYLSIVLFFFATATSLAHPGVGIVMDTKGNVFYTDLKHIWKINLHGKLSIAVSHVHSHEIYLDERDNLYGEHLWYEGEATNKWGHYVWRLSSNGKLEKIIPTTEGFRYHYSFVRDHHDQMYWTEQTDKCQHLVMKDTENNIAKISNYCFQDIRWMTTSQQGNVYLVDRFDLKKVDTQGNVQTLATNLQERKLAQFTVLNHHLLMGIWTDEKENAYVAIYGGRMVKKVTQDKKITVVAETSIGWSPTGGLVAPNGDFWLLEYSLTNAVRVERISPDGTRTIYSSRE